MIRPIDIRINAAHPELPLVEATTFVGSPSSVFVRGVPKSCGNWRITAVSVAVTYPDNTTTARAAVESAQGVWVATIPGTATSGRTIGGFRILADGEDENGAAVTGYVLGFADFAVFSMLPVPAPGEMFYIFRYFDAQPATPKKGDAAIIGGVLKYYNGTTWLPFADLTNYYTKAETDEAIDKLAAYYITADAQGNPFATHAALVNAQTYYSGGAVRIPTRNDYAVVSADETHGGAEYRYIYAVPDGSTTGQWEAQYPIETNDYGQLSNKPQINGNTLTGNKTAADLGLATKADATLTERGYSGWNILHTPLTAEQKAAFYAESEFAASYDYKVEIEEFAGEWHLYVGGYHAATVVISEDGLEATFDSSQSQEATTIWGPNGTTVATRTALSGYQLGSQADKPLASEAEAEALRDGKLDKSSATWNVSYTEDGLHIADNVGMYYVDISPAAIKTNFPNADHVVFWPINRGTTALLENLAGNFSSSTAYAKDALVVYTSAFYRCVNPNGHTGAWVDADFTPATVEDVLAALRTGKADKPTTFTAGNLAALDASGNPTDAGWTAGELARYSLVAKTIANGAVTLDDRAINAVAISSSLASLTVNFPTATPGKARDFGLRLTVASGITTAPELALPQGVTCENADGAAPEIGADGAATILYFTETASGVFLVKGEVVTAIS